MNTIEDATGNKVKNYEYEHYFSNNKGKLLLILK